MFARSMRRLLLAWLPVCLAPAFTWADVCCEPYRVHETSWACTDAGDCNPWCLADDESGGVYILAEMDTREHYLLSSQDQGATWESRLLSARFDYHPYILACASNQAGDIVAVYRWSDDRLYAIGIHDQGRTIDPPVWIDGGSPSPSCPVIDMGPTGLTAVLWQAEVETQPLTADRIWAVISRDGGRTWHSAREIHATIEGSFHMARSWAGIAASQSAVIAAWFEKFELWAARRDPLRWRWDDAQWVAAIQGRSTPRMIGTASSFDGAFQIAYEEPESGQLVRVSTDDGITWPDDRHLHAGTAYGDYHALPCGTVHLAGRVDQQLVVRSSAHHGLPGTWTAPVEVPGGTATGARSVAFDSDPSRNTWLVEQDGRNDTDTCPDCESVYLTRSCDGGMTWFDPQTRLDSDLGPFPVMSIQPLLSVSALGRAHVVWVDSDRQNPTGTSWIRYAAFDAEPMVRPSDLRCSTSCARGLYFLEAVGGGQEACPDAAWQWFLDGTPVPGAVDRRFRVPGDLPLGNHEIHYVVQCGAPLPCGGESASFPVEVLDEPGDLLEYEIEEPVRVTRERDGIRLAWSDLEVQGRGYHIYAGTIDALHRDRTYDHEALVCGIPRPDLAAVDFERLVPFPPENTYYLIGAAGCWNEGSLGNSSARVPRPVPGVGPSCGGMP